jgi:ABC-type multidrug transport system ATPase subunit
LLELDDMTLNPTPSPPPVLLKVQGLSFSYPGRPVFTDWSFDFAAGLSWVRGSNGSGKSTLLKLLGGALPPLTGALSACGIALADDGLGYRREVFWCGPGDIAFDHLKPLEYFAFIASLYPRFDIAAAHELALQLGLEPFLHKPLAALSTGTRRKVWLAAAFNAGSAVVLLDEPLNALDRVSVRTVRERLEACSADTRQAWVVVSHDGLGAAEAAAVVLDLPEPAV